MRIGRANGRLVIIDGDGVIDAAARSDGQFSADPDRVFAVWDRFTEWAGGYSGPGAHTGPLAPEDLGAPVLAPPQVFGIGLNYRKHAAESGVDAPDVPPVFTKFRSCLAAPYATVELPSDRVDWEVELVAVIGRPAERVPEDKAWSYVAGVLVGQDLSERTVQLAGPVPQFSLGKSFPGFGPTGPWLVTPDELPARAGLAQLAPSVTLATAVAPIYHRSPASMAQTAATIDDLSGGRFRLGLGTGHRATMGGWHGQDIGNPVAEMREYVALVRALLTGGEPPAGLRWNSSFAFNGFTARADIPVYLAGLSPAMLRLAGEIADGVVLWACPASYVGDVAMREIAAGRARAGQPLAGFDVCAAIPSAVVADPAAARRGIRAELHRYFGLPFYRAMFAQAGYEADIAAYDAAADVSAQRAAISDAFIEDLCAIGKPEDVAAGVARYRAAGATNPMITNITGTDLGPTLHAAVAA